MNTGRMQEAAERLVAGMLRERGMELVALGIRREGWRLVVSVLADKPEGGISLEECAGLNRCLGEALDAAALIGDSYLLEVSSPGLDRPLKTSRDFQRHLNKPAKFFLNGQINGRIEWDGTIQQVREDLVVISTSSGLLEIPFAIINKAKLLIA